MPTTIKTFSKFTDVDYHIRQLRKNFEENPLPEISLFEQDMETFFVSVVYSDKTGSLKPKSIKARKFKEDSKVDGIYYDKYILDEIPYPNCPKILLFKSGKIEDFYYKDFLGLSLEKDKWESRLYFTPSYIKADNYYKEENERIIKTYIEKPKKKSLLNKFFNFLKFFPGIVPK